MFVLQEAPNWNEVSPTLVFCIVVIVMLRERTGARLMSNLGIALAMSAIRVVIGLYSFFQCSISRKEHSVYNFVIN